MTIRKTSSTAYNIMLTTEIINLDVCVYFTVYLNVKIFIFINNQYNISTCRSIMETICDPCSEKNKRLVAEKYCTDCEEKLCTECAEWHIWTSVCISQFILEDGILDPTDDNSIT
jgi:hypothetical protein